MLSDCGCGGAYALPIAIRCWLPCVTGMPSHGVATSIYVVQFNGIPFLGRRNVIRAVDEPMMW